MTTIPKIEVKEEQITPLYIASKKISKTKVFPSKSKRVSTKSALANLSKYETFNTEEKRMILKDVWQGLMLALDIKVDEINDLFARDLIKLVQDIDLKIYNKVIVNVLAKYVPTFDPSSPAKVYSQWRKKIKSWALNCGKPENRGNPLVPMGKAELFREKLIGILNTMTYRHFTDLRQKVMVVVNEFTKLGYYGSKASVKKTCSKHWWFDFINRNAEFKAMWEKIPLERSARKYKQIPLVQTGKDKKVNIGPLAMTDPIFSVQGFSTTPYSDDSTLTGNSGLLPMAQVKPHNYLGQVINNVQEAFKTEFKIELEADWSEKVEDSSDTIKMELEQSTEYDIKTEHVHIVKFEEGHMKADGMFIKKEEKALKYEEAEEKKTKQQF